MTARLAPTGDFAYVDPDGQAANGRIAVVRADGPGRATPVWRIAVESSRSVLQAAARRPDIAVIRARETMMRAVVMFVGRAV